MNPGVIASMSVNINHAMPALAALSATKHATTTNPVQKECKVPSV
jgi:hypothetical protein